MSSWKKPTLTKPKGLASKQLSSANLPSYWFSTTSLAQPKLHFITVATIGHPNLDKLKGQVKSKNQILLTLGSEMNRPIGWVTGGNFGIKLLEVFNFLMRPNIDPFDIILFTDAFDVAYVGNEEELLRRFQKFKKPIVFGAEKLCSPDAELAGQYPKTDSEFKFLNSGGFIGRVWAPRRCMADYNFNDMIEDQRYWIAKFLKNQDLIELDYNLEIFLNCVETDKKDHFFDGFNAYYKHAQPLVIHANGSDKSYVDIYFGSSS